MTDNKKILEKLREFLKKENLNVFIVNSTDEYLNEYINPEENSRYLLSNFSGSTGDMLITQGKAFLFVDGRYHLQAETETDPEIVTLVKVDLGKSPQKALFEKLAEISDGKINIGFVSSKTSCASFKELLKNVENDQDMKIVEYEDDPVIKLADIKKEIGRKVTLRYIPSKISGKTPEQKLELVNNYKTENNIDFLLVTNLADIAYLTNLRGKEIPFSSCFKSQAIIFRGRAYIFTDLDRLPAEIKNNFDENFIFCQENDFNNFIEKIAREEKVSSIFYHPGTTTLAVFRKIEKLSEKIIEIKESYISGMKSLKNTQELQYISECYLKTDIIVSRTICWLNQNLENGLQISEKDLSDKVKSLFKEDRANGLSFEPITAAGRNTAYIHYTNPNPEKYIKNGDLILLDCGAYFENGYATDQTRTFLAGSHEVSANELQKKVYTAVLKGLLKGINLEPDENTTGYDLDTAVREVVDANKPEGFDFSHATGHGVGIIVHESPPRIGPSESSKTSLKPGMVFTIEPGLYNEEWGGVRLENTVTLTEENGKIIIKTLTRASLDENLINYKMLTDEEKIWLEKYNRSRIG